jgi:hypothetical protein
MDYRFSVEPGRFGQVIRIVAGIVTRVHLSRAHGHEVWSALESPSKRRAKCAAL